jgi:anaerobic selenocysteine-containing dehydrogenase
VDANGEPRRIDHAYSWRYPLAVHGMLHTVIRNAWARDPAPVDVLFMFMANMSWNSAMNTSETMHWLTDRDPYGGYRIPRIIYADAYSSEMVAYADLVLPTLPTSSASTRSRCSTARSPMPTAPPTRSASRCCRWMPRAPGRDVRGFQSVLLELGARLGLPAMLKEDGSPRYRDYADYIVNHERAPGVGLLAGWRGAGGESQGKGAPIPRSSSATSPMAASGARKSGVGALLQDGQPRLPGMVDITWIHRLRIRGGAAAVLGDAAEIPTGRAGPRAGATAGARSRARRALLRSAADLVRALRRHAGGPGHLPLSAVTQRPPFMYHAWGSQNAWLRQIATRNWLYVHPDTAAAHGLADGGMAHLDSHHGRITVPVRLAANVQPDTVWTWNAIGKRRGAWKLSPEAPEGKQGFLLNHLISDKMPKLDYANADPVTGQAAWFDLRVRLTAAQVADDAPSEPQFDVLPGPPADDAPLRYGARFRKEKA